jgi:hypothetical protein
MSQRQGGAGAKSSLIVGGIDVPLFSFLRLLYARVFLGICGFKEKVNHTFRTRIDDGCCCLGKKSFGFHIPILPLQRNLYQQATDGQHHVTHLSNIDY